MANWTYRSIPVAPGRTFPLFTSGSIPSPLLGTAANPLTGFKHWMDSDLATAWFRRARGLALRSTSSLMSLTQVATGAQSVQLYHDQALFIHQIAEAIANGFNALNIPWYLHRASRELYWTYLSGRPVMAYMFSKSTNANGTRDGWYTDQRDGAQDGLPVVTDRSTGTIPRIGRALYKKRVGNVSRNLFVQTVGIGISLWNIRGVSDLDEALRTGSATDDWYLRDDIVNHSFVRSVLRYDPNFLFSQVGQDLTAMCSGTREPPVLQTTYAAWSPMAYPLHKCDTAMPHEGWIVANENSSLDGANSLGDSDDWRSFRGDFGAHIGDVPMRMSMGPFHYLQWLKDWTAILVAQTPEEIVSSAREMAIYCNTKWLESNARAASAILSAASDQMAQATARDPNLRYAEAAVGAAGAALASVTYGISAVAAAVINLGIEIGVALQDPDGDKVIAGRDDLGRIKPILERSWLSGNPADPTADGTPRIDVPPVPGTPAGPFASNRFTATIGRQRLGMNAEILNIQPLVVPEEPPVSEQPSQSSNLLLPALGVGAIAAFAGYKLLTNKRK